MTPAQLASGARSHLGGVWRQPVLRSGYLLTANAAVTAVVGVAFWLLAARLYSPAVVGANAAAISAMLFLAGVAQLNLMSAVLRFVPTAPTAARRLITTAFAVAAGLSGAAAAVFLTGLQHWAPGLARLFASPVAQLGFILATMATAVSVLQDTALVAVGRSGGVVIENFAGSVLKVAGIVAVVALLPRSGLWYSWTASTLLAVIGTCTFLFARAVPSFARTPSAASAAPTLRDMGRYIGPDYVGSLAWIACTALVPVLVFNLTDPTAAAAFALAWSICLALYGIPAAFGQSMVAHGSRESARPDERQHRILIHTLGLLVPIVIVVEVAAPLLLAPFGPWYAEHAAPVLRLLVVSTLPNAVVALEVSRARVAREMAVVVTTLVSLAVIVLGLTLLLVPRLGVTGAGVAWLCGELVVATGVLLRRVPGIGRVRVRHHVLVPPPYTLERQLSTASDTAVALVRSGACPGVLKVALTERGRADLQREREVLTRLAAVESLGPWRHLLPSVLVAAPDHLITTRLFGRHARHPRASALDAIEVLHRLDATPTRLGGELLDELVTRPARVVEEALIRSRDRAALDQVTWCLRHELAGCKVALGWSHGDFWPGNVLVADDGTVTGVLDWAQARPNDLAVLDTVQWLLTTSGHGSFGRRVTRRLSRGYWTRAEFDLLLAGQPEPIPGHALLLLGWLRHVSDNLAKSDRYRTSAMWRRRNVLPVLRAATR